ncbi:MAG TPA: hypothetical protein VKC90_01390, partial [Chitinophagaceae bacterium]|nr:hypothetical protein [Chitinophagaceae bacterium]
MLLIKILIGSSIFFLLMRIYYGIKLESKDKNKASIFGKMFGGVYGGGIIFPILRKSKSLEEK